MRWILCWFVDPNCSELRLRVVSPEGHSGLSAFAERFGHAKTAVVGAWRYPAPTNSCHTTPTIGWIRHDAAGRENRSA